MNFCYRGNLYKHQPTLIKMSEGEVTGKYRGVNWKYCRPQKTPLPQTMLKLKYRGVSYYAGLSTIQGEAEEGELSPSLDR